MDSVYTLVGLAMSESHQVTSDCHMNDVKNHENEVQHQDYSPPMHNPRIMSADDDTQSNKLSIEFLMDHKIKDFNTDGKTKRRPVKLYSSESESVASVSADEKVRRKSSKKSNQNSSPPNTKGSDSGDVSKPGKNLLKETLSDFAISPPQQCQRLNNEEYAQNAQHGLYLANEAFSEMKNSCEALKRENETLKVQLSESKEKYSNDVNSQNDLLIKANKIVEALNKKINWHQGEIDKFEKDIVKSKEESIQIYKSLSEANKTIRSFENKLQGLDFENKRLQNENNSHLEITNDMKNKIELLKSENEKLSNKKEIIERENRNYEKETTFLKNELKTIEKELLLNKNEVKKLHSDCKNYENQIQSLENNIKSLQEDKCLILKLNQEVNKNIDECINESTILRHHNSSLEDNNRDLKCQIQKLTVKLEEVQGQAKIEANALRRELTTAKEQSNNLHRQLISNCPTSRIMSQAGCQNSTINNNNNINETLLKEKSELEQELLTYQKKYREIKKLYMHGLFSDKVAKKQSPRKEINKNELNKLYDNIGDFENNCSSNLTLDLSAHLEDPENHSMVQNIASLIFNERNEYWSEKSKEELEEARRKIKKMDDEIKHLKNNISKASAVIKC